MNYLAKLRGHQPTWTYQQPLENGNAITDTILIFIWRSGKTFYRTIANILWNTLSAAQSLTG